MGGCSSKNSSSHKSPSSSSKPNLRMKKGNNVVNKNEIKNIEAKVVLLGDQNVGKSSIAQKFCKDIFTGQYVVTIGGAYFQQKFIMSNGTIIKFHIWDTGGHERFRSMASIYYQDAAVAILTYDVNDEKTFESLNYWINELKNKIDPNKIVICVAGNKCDKDPTERKISFNKGKELADLNNYLFFETSAKSDIGIKEMFQALAKKILV